ncbi:MAG: insulinase family protein [Clostridia bacterium]|nr:insulinase family protein [Clostridia bacterium]
MTELFENTALGEKYYKTNVKGLDIYIIPKKLSTVYASVAVNFGSSDVEFEREGERVRLPAGTAHFLEHKMFDMPDGTDAFEQFSLLGANANAYTAASRTCYMFTCTDNFADSLALLLRVVKEPCFSDASVDKERPIITQEIRMYMDDPYWKMHFGLLGALYKDDPIKDDPAGSEETIAEISPELLYSCHRAFYRNDNMALCVCGDVEVDTVVSVAETVLEKTEPVSLTRIRPEESPMPVFDRAEFRLDVGTPLFAVGIKCAPPADGEGLMRADAEHEIILQAIFGKSGSFYNGLYEEGLLGDRFSSGYSSEAGCAHIMLYGSSDDPDLVYRRVYEELCRRRNGFLDAEEFERAKKVCYSAALDTYNGTEDTANAFIGFVFEGGDLFKYTDYLRNASYEDVKKTFMESYKPERMAFSVIYSKEEQNG